MQMKTGWQSQSLGHLISMSAPLTVANQWHAFGPITKDSLGPETSLNIQCGDWLGSWMIRAQLTKCISLFQICSFAININTFVCLRCTFQFCQFLTMVRKFAHWHTSRIFDWTSLFAPVACLRLVFIFCLLYFVFCILYLHWIDVCIWTFCNGENLPLAYSAWSKRFETGQRQMWKGARRLLN